MKKKFILVISVFITFSVFSQSKLPSNYEGYRELLNAGQISTGASVLQNSSILDAFINPSVLADKKRYILDFNYTGIVGYQNVSTSSSPYPGNSVNLGLGIPTRAGYISISSGYIGASSGNGFISNLSNQGFLSFSIAKDVYKDFYMGMGLKTILVDDMSSNAVLYDILADIAFTHKVGDLGRVKDFKWSMALQNLGWGSLAVNNFNKSSGFYDELSPSLFTLDSGLSFTAFSKDDFSIEYEAGLRLPTFQNLVLSSGANFCYKDIFEFNISIETDIRELAGVSPSVKDYSSLIPSFGFLYRYKPKYKEKEDIKNSEVHIRAGSGAVLNSSMWGYSLGLTVPFGSLNNGGPDIDLQFSKNDINKKSYNKKYFLRNISSSSSKREVKEIKVGSSKKNNIILEENSIKKYISPNGDGIQDDLSISLNINNRNYISDYKFVFKDEEGNIVKTIKNNKDKNISKEKDFFIRLFKLKKDIDIPDKIVWNCKNEKGEIVKDGIYSLTFYIYDYEKNVTERGPFYFEIDTIAPSVDFNLKKYDLVFSPNKDGNKDLLIIKQKSSNENSWKVQLTHPFLGTILDYDISGKLPNEFVWAGKNSRGFMVPDGIYKYSVSSTDLAGNSVEKVLSNISMVTDNSPINLVISNKGLSPNGDGLNDSITFTPKMSVNEGILDWDFTIFDENKNIVMEVNGENSSVPDSFIFYGKDREGLLVREGNYGAELNVKYINGNNPKSITPEFSVDITKPSANINLDYSVFSPDNDEKKDFLIINQKTSSEDLWESIITDDKGDIVYKKLWYNSIDSIFKYDGIGSDGKVLSDGKYSYKLIAKDSAGNIGESNSVNFSIDTLKSDISLELSEKAFSPNGDGIKDFIDIFPKISKKSKIESFQIEIYDSSGELVYNLKKSKFLNDAYRWSGFSLDNDLVDDGVYKVRLFVKFSNGYENECFSRNFVLDNSMPKIVVDYDNLYFSPNNDGKRDYLSFPQESSIEKFWDCKIINYDDRVVKTLYKSGKLDNFYWDGKDSEGNILPDGIYSYLVKCEDDAGNICSMKIPNIVIDTSMPTISLVSSKKGFSPNNDKRLDNIKFDLDVKKREGIDKWEVLIENIDNKSKKVFSGENSVPKKIIWNGVNSDKNIVEGKYNVTFKVSYFNGYIATENDEISLDISSPLIDCKINPIPFSPDSDGVNDKLNINLSFIDKSNILKWQLKIKDPKGNSFKNFEGKNSDYENIVWDGYGDKGDLVFSAEDYPYTIKVIDEYGNMSLKEGYIPIDVLVIRDGDKLKIRIANITFAPNSAKLDSKSYIKSMETLSKVAKILKKYKDYKVIVEGHANALMWNDYVKAKNEEKNELQPLSEKRASAIREELIKLGISVNRLSIKGCGGRFPLVNPKKDEKLWKTDKWKNRRVEFILEK